MIIDEVMDSLVANLSVVDREVVLKAYHFAEKAHEGQKRASGEPYVTHCVAVANILVDLKVPVPIIVAGLLHDTVEDSSVTLEDIRANFGDEVAQMVDGVTMLTNLPGIPRSDQRQGEALKNHDTLTSVEGEDDSRRRGHSPEMLRKILLAMANDSRVILVKLADRLHNMRTLHFMPENKRKRIAQETLDIFAPLANRLGIWQIKWELEDLAFSHVNPAKYKEIADLLAQRRTDRENQIQDIIHQLQAVLAREGITTEVTGRPKHIYSIYKKMTEKGKTFESVLDLRAVRLIVPDKPTCYAALGIVHSHWRPIPNEFDDYIAAPKENEYQSLHTAVLYDDGKPLEVQIRTPEMHQNAEYGFAAHWRYKEKGGRLEQAYQQQVNEFRKIILDWLKEVTDDQEFVDGVKTDVFQDRVYAFTPRGDVIDLPKHATPIDFAYSVHTEIGHHCRGAKVNGRLVTLDYQIKSGEVVEILTTKHGGPSRDWLNTNLGLVKTQRARSKIRNWFKWQNREQNILQGRTVLERELKRLGIEPELEKLAKLFDYHSVDDMFLAVGTGDLSTVKIVNKISDLGKDKAFDPLLGTQASESKTITDPSAITVYGLKGMLTTLARCCKPVPGDVITGYVTRGRGVTVHRFDCPNILRLQDQERVVKVGWGQAPKTYPVPVEVKAYDRQGLIQDISNVLAEENINILEVGVKVSHHLATFNLILELGDIAQLSRVLTRIENLPNVIESYRARPG